jgi:hypothetical protein
MNHASVAIQEASLLQTKQQPPSGQDATVCGCAPQFGRTISHVHSRTRARTLIMLWQTTAVVNDDTHTLSVNTFGK